AGVAGAERPWEGESRIADRRPRRTVRFAPRRLRYAGADGVAAIAPGCPGTGRSGIGLATNRRRASLASRRARCCERATRALSVAMPVFAYIWRYSFEMSTKAARARSERTQAERSQIAGSA